MVETAQYAWRSRKSAPGFTLIEVLVIVIIIGIVSAVVLLSLGVLGDDRSLQQQARRISSLIEMSSDEALMEGRDFGVEFKRTGYRFLEFDALTAQWHEIVGDDLLRPRQMDDDMEFALELEDRDVKLSEEFVAVKTDDDRDKGNDKNDEDKNKSAGMSSPNKVMANDYAPHVVISSSGDVSPFVLHILRSVDRTEVVVDMQPDGQMEIRNDAEPAT